eukprot:TRINITY_DN23310_c0_g1_i1.p1 TRINITY_DN23310_c0_g1~~TRINITY_DN23310_c0_g1_i1.p1  ORF type:complete len:1055 (+),score=403.59 TRINITY_DN23310_c0_g1_i1:200-3364(+)
MSYQKLDTGERPLGGPRNYQSPSFWSIFSQRYLKLPTDPDESSDVSQQFSLRDLAWIKIRALFTLAYEFWKYNWRQLKKSKVNYTLGFFACFIVVVVVSLLLTVLANTPVVFLSLAERIVSEADFEVWSDNANLNLTLIEQLVQHSDSQGKFGFISPRYWERTPFGYAGCNSLGNNVTGSLPAQCALASTASLALIDSAREKAIGVGRAWPFGSMKPNEIIISSQLAKDLQTGIGQTLAVRIDPAAYLGQAWTMIFSRRNSVPGVGIELVVTVKGVVSAGAYGRIPSRIARFAFMEYGSFFPQLVAAAPATLFTPDELESARAVNLYEYASYLVMELPPSERMKYYITSDFDAIQNDVTRFGSDFSYLVGFNNLKMTLPILDNIRAFNVVSMFLGLIINIIIFILLFICVVLIYSLLITNVETRTFEMGMLRMLGMKRTELITLMLNQALSYVLFSFPLGLLVSQLLCVWLASTMGSLLSIQVAPWLNGGAIGMAALMGLGMPLLASILPIRAALGSTLAEAIDTRNSRTKAVSISVNRSEDETFSLPQVLIGLFMISFGFSIYYLLPYSLLSMNLSILLYIFVSLLVGMLMGLAVLSQNVQGYVEQVLVAVLFFWDRPSVRGIVLKNLVAHRPRNRKTSLLYAISLGFIVFISVSYSIEVASFKLNMQQDNGCFLKIRAVGLVNGYPNSISSIEQIEQYAAASSHIVNFGWVSTPLLNLHNFNSLQATNLGHVKRYNWRVFGVSPHLFDVMIHDPEFLSVASAQTDGLPLLESLYTVKGSSSMIVGSLFEKAMGLRFDEPFLLDANVQTATGQSSKVYRPLLPLAFLNGAPGFQFSPFPAIRSQDGLVSLASYVRLANGSVPSVERIPMSAFIIQLKDDASDDDVDQVKQGLEAIFSGQTGVSFWDYRDQTDSLDTATSILGYFFDFTTIVAMLVSFFSLNSSMYSNIFEQTKEISVLRSLGLTKFAMYRIYIYEALVLVLGSSFLGICIGTCVSYSMVLQQALFTQLPLPFVLPYQLMAVVAACSLVFSVLASWGPISFLLRMSIVDIMRYL